MSVLKLDAQSFDEAVKEGRVLVDFYADWCGPCRMLSPVVDEIAEEGGDFVVAKVNVDNEPNIANEYSISAIPTLLVFKNGEVVNKSVGVISKEEILNLLNV